MSKKPKAPTLICPNCGSINCRLIASSDHPKRIKAHAVCNDCGTARPKSRFLTGGPDPRKDDKRPYYALGGGGLWRSPVRNGEQGD